MFFHKSIIRFLSFDNLILIHIGNDVLLSIRQTKSKLMSPTFHEHVWECNFITHLSNSSKVDYANTIIFNHVHSNNKSRIIFLLVIHICSKSTLDANPMYPVIYLSQQATGISTLLLYLLDFL